MTDYNYFSNTVGAGGNQFFFDCEGDGVGRVFYKINESGLYNYSLLFTNVTDSTYANGAKSRANEPCGEWSIRYARAARCAFASLTEADADINYRIDCCTQILFGGKPQKTVGAGEVFASDGFWFFAEKGEYLCLEIGFSGRRIPCHTESILPIFRKTDGAWVYSTDMPLPACVGCDMEQRTKIAFFGDSITQGIGTSVNSYKHWCATLADMLGEEYAYWNLGIGYGRAADAASGGIWLQKALMNDIIFVCFGVNDLLQGYSTDEIKKSLAFIARTLKENGKRVIFQTLPPFDYVGKQIDDWMDINNFIIQELSQTVDLVFDCVPVLRKENEPHLAEYGGHPNETGCAEWALALYEAVKDIF